MSKNGETDWIALTLSAVGGDCFFPKKLAFHSDYGEPRRGGHKTPPTARDAFERARLVGLTQFTTNKLNSQTTN